MFSIDGRTIDLTQPSTLSGITLKPGGYIEQCKDGKVVTLKNTTPVVQPASGNKKEKS